MTCLNMTDITYGPLPAGGSVTAFPFVVVVERVDVVVAVVVVDVNSGSK